MEAEPAIKARPTGASIKYKETLAYSSLRGEKEGRQPMPNTSSPSGLPRS